MGTMIQDHTHYTSHTFEGLSIKGMEFIGCEFLECQFLSCRLSGVVFRNCRFIASRLKDCDLSLFQGPGSMFAGAIFEDSKLIGVDWTPADWDSIRIGDPLHFNRCTLDHSTFIGLSLVKTQFIDCLCREVDFRETDLSGADFSGCDLVGSLFSKTNLSGANLSSARNYHIHPGENQLQQAKFALPEALSLLYNMGIDLSDEGRGLP